MTSYLPFLLLIISLAILERGGETYNLVNNGDLPLFMAGECTFCTTSSKHYITTLEAKTNKQHPFLKFNPSCHLSWWSRSISKDGRPLWIHKTSIFLPYCSSIKEKMISCLTNPQNTPIYQIHLISWKNSWWRLEESCFSPWQCSNKGDVFISFFSCTIEKIQVARR